jgi:hypothetical protein
MLNPYGSGGAASLSSLGRQGEDEFRTQSNTTQGGQANDGALAAMGEGQLPAASGSPFRRTSPTGRPAQATPTFAELRRQGRARPAPPSPLQQRIQQSVMGLLDQPSAYGTPQMQQAMAMFNENLDREARTGRRRVDESLAARGFYDGTEAARALGTFEADLDRQRRQYATQLQLEQAARLDEARRSAITQALGVDESELRRTQATRGMELDEDEAALRELGARTEWERADRNDLLDLLDRLGTTRVASLEDIRR